MLQHLHLSARGMHQARHQVHQGRLAGAVGANQAGDALRDREVDAIHAQDFAIKLRDVLKDNFVVDRSAHRIAHRTTS